MNAEKKQSSPSLQVEICVVLDNDDILREILLCLTFTTSLIRAALVSRGWLRIASDPAFQGRFYDLHPPPRLGFYVQNKNQQLLRFVSMPDLPDELATTVHRARSALGAYADSKVSMLSSTDGYLLVRHHQDPNNSRDELLCLLPPEREALILQSSHRPRTPPLASSMEKHGSTIT